ncbi:hypothetical protein QBC37DRAFT_400437 [Rhypophila decipiens]|uniref:F-box domain-containing protein n=1 Tax=Rhypophila decipiens TaxID=261697 RepID=A0AAN6YCQ8_9PEZI|nr:hypothetical protein QBC37DRAFT_400437 [Rhypophila decipiens]
MDAQLTRGMSTLKRKMSEDDNLNQPSAAKGPDTKSTEFSGNKNLPTDAALAFNGAGTDGTGSTGNTPPTATFQSLPQEMFDEIARWLTGHDAKKLCLASKSMYAAFAGRKWRSISLNARLILWSNRPWDYLRVTTRPETIWPRALPLAQYRSIIPQELDCKDSGALPLRHMGEQLATRIRRTLDVISASPSLQFLRIDPATFARLEGHSRVTGIRLPGVLNGHSPWESIRLLAINYLELETTENKHYGLSDELSPIKLIREMLTSHMPNLLGLDLDFRLCRERDHSARRETLLYLDIVRRFGASLRRLCINNPVQRGADWDDDTRRAPRTQGLGLPLRVLERVCNDFPALEWLAMPAWPTPIYGLRPDFYVSIKQAAIDVYNRNLDACVEHLQKLTSLKRLALGLCFEWESWDPFEDSSDDNYWHQYWDDFDKRYGGFIKAFANKVLNGIPSLEEVYFFLDYEMVMRFDRTKPELLDPDHGDLPYEFPISDLVDGIWPLGIKAGQWDSQVGGVSGFYSPRHRPRGDIWSTLQTQADIDPAMPGVMKLVNTRLLIASQRRQIAFKQILEYAERTRDNLKAGLPTDRPFACRETKVIIKKIAEADDRSTVEDLLHELTMRAVVMSEVPLNVIISLLRQDMDREQ